MGLPIESPSAAWPMTVSRMTSVGGRGGSSSDMSGRALPEVDERRRARREPLADEVEELERLFPSEKEHVDEVAFVGCRFGRVGMTGETDMKGSLLGVPGKEGGVGRKVEKEVGVRLRIEGRRTRLGWIRGTEVASSLEMECDESERWREAMASIGGMRVGEEKGGRKRVAPTGKKELL